MRDITLKNSRVTNADVVRMLQSYKANAQRYLGCRVHLVILPTGEIDWYLSGHPNELACLNDQVQAGRFIKLFEHWYNQLPVECRTILFHCYINHDFELANTMGAWLEYEWGRMKFRTLPVRRLAVLFDCSTSKLYKMKRWCLERLTGIINEEMIEAIKTIPLDKKTKT
jgi:hypothetical protein